MIRWIGRWRLGQPQCIGWLLAALTACLLCQPSLADEAKPLPAGPQLASLIHYQLAIYYPAPPVKPPLPALQARLKALPQAPQLVERAPDEPSGPVMLATFEKNALKTYAPPSMDMIKYFGRGLSHEQAVAMQKADQALIMDFGHPRAVAMPAYRNSLLLVEQVARDTNGLLWDDESRELFTPEAWHQRRLEGWHGDTPDVLKHVAIHAYQGDKLVRAITLGMAKFGAPDVVVEDFSWSNNRQMGNLINLTAQALAEGAVVGPQGFFDLDIHDIKHPGVRQSQLDTLLPRSTGVAPLMLVQGTPESGDPNNRLAEIRFGRAEGPDRYAQQDALLAGLFGSADAIKRIKHDDELLQASQRAKARLPALRDAFNKGLQPGEYLMLKAPFGTPSGDHEWMWVEVTKWQGDAISGLLKNEPFDIPTLHAGQIVQVQQQDVFDYLRRRPDGKEEGNETSKIIERMQGATEKR